MKKFIITTMIVVLAAGNATAILTNKNLNKRIQQIEHNYQETKQNEADLINQLKNLYDEKEKIQQELNNIKSLGAANNTVRGVAFSRGGNIFIHTTYNTKSRIDVATGISAELLNQAFIDTKMDGLGNAFVKAEKETGINAIFLAAIAALESGWGSSDNARNKNNLFGWGSWDNDSSKTVIFNSKEEGVLKVAQGLARDYIDPNGQYYNGATPYGVNIRYCSSSAWKDKITSIMNTIVNRVAK